MGALEYSVWINARPEDVWRTYCDPSRLSEWQTGSPVIADIQGSGDQPGSTYTSARGPGTARTTVLTADPPRRIVTMTAAYFGLKFDVDTHLVPEADGTLLRLRAETHWPRGLGLVGKVVERAILGGSEAGRELANLKALVEREAGAPRR
ncbi:MAG: hypothetical protein JWQ75_4059 [Pseudarthrobacter sp.]|nr:hypothetical protein [Pseudarthrobacter sp.]